MCGVHYKVWPRSTPHHQLYLQRRFMCTRDRERTEKSSFYGARVMRSPAVYSDERRFFLTCQMTLSLSWINSATFRSALCQMMIMLQRVSAPIVKLSVILHSTGPPRRSYTSGALHYANNLDMVLKTSSMWRWNEYFPRQTNRKSFIHNATQRELFFFGDYYVILQSYGYTPFKWFEENIFLRVLKNLYFL